MGSEIVPAPDPDAAILWVGQDRDGSWLVQEIMV